MAVKCCFVECGKEAEYEIIYGNSPDDATYSCASHIGELVDDSIGRFEVLRLEKEEKNGK